MFKKLKEWSDLRSAKKATKIYLMNKITELIQTELEKLSLEKEVLEQTKQLNEMVDTNELQTMVQTLKDFSFEPFLETALKAKETKATDTPEEPMKEIDPLA